MIRVISKFIQKIDADREISRTTDKILADIAADFEAIAKEGTPVLTGRLRASIAAKKVKFLEYEVGTNVNYAPHVEYGTVHSQPRSMMRKAAAEIERKGSAQFVKLRIIR